MSLKTTIEERGVKLADLAKEIEEAYGNVYTALKMEAAGGEIKSKSVNRRLQLIRDWLSSSVEAEERTANSVEGKGNRDALWARVQGIPGIGPKGQTKHRTAKKIKGGEISCGDVLTIQEDGETVRLKFLAFVVSEDHGEWVDVYGGPGLGEKCFPRYRSLRPEILGLERA